MIILSEPTASSSAPWWGSALIAALAALLVAAGSVFYTFYRHKQEDQRRWERDLRTLCAAYMTALEEYKETSPYGNLDRNIAASHRLELAHRELQMLAPQEVLLAAVVANTAMSEWAHAEPATNEHVRKYYQARFELLNEIRKAIGQPTIDDSHNWLTR
jgi:hypothetical protein